MKKEESTRFLAFLSIVKGHQPFQMYHELTLSDGSFSKCTSLLLALISITASTIASAFALSKLLSGASPVMVNLPRGFKKIWRPPESAGYFITCCSYSH